MRKSVSLAEEKNAFETPPCAGMLRMCLWQHCGFFFSFFFIDH